MLNDLHRKHHDGSPIRGDFRLTGYWERTLAGMPERLILPTDRPYPQVADHRGATTDVHWPAELQRGLREVARAHGACTPPAARGYAASTSITAGQRPMSTPAWSSEPPTPVPPRVST